MKTTLALTLSLSIFLAGSASTAYALKTNNGVVDYFADQTVHYTACDVELNMSASKSPSGAVQSLEVLKLTTHCVHPTYWVFSQQLRPVKFVVNAQKQILLSSVPVGTLDEQGNFQIAYTADSEKIFLNGTNTPDGFVIDWAARSFDEVNFDLTAKFK